MPFALDTIGMLALVWLAIVSCHIVRRRVWPHDRWDAFILWTMVMAATINELADYLWRWWP